MAKKSTPVEAAVVEEQVLECEWRTYPEIQLPGTWGELG